MKYLILRRGVRVFTAVFCCMGGFTAGIQSVGAQISPPLQNPRSIVTPTDAYLVGSPLPLAGANALAYPDPRGRYVLFVRSEEALPPARAKEQLTSGRTSLSIYDSHTQHIRELWTTNPPIGGTGAGAVIKVEWLSGVDAALIVTREDPSRGAASDQKPEYTLLCLHPDKGSRGLQTFLHTENRLIFWRSPSAPYAVVTEIIENGIPEETGSLAPKRIIDDRGQIGPILHLDTDFLGLEWSEDGKTLFASIQSQTDPPDIDSAVPAKRSKRSVAVDATTGEVHVISTLPRNRRVSPSLVRQAQTKPPAQPLRIVTDTVTSTLPGPPSSGRPKSGVRLTPLYLQYVGGDQTDWMPAAGNAVPPLNSSVFLADNGSDAVVLADLSAVVYTAHGALYAVSIVHETRSAFDKASGLAPRAETQAKLKTIASAISQYMSDSDGHHYPPAAGLAAALKTYLNDPDLLGSGFTYLLNGDSYPGDAAAATLIVAYLAGPDGRAILMGNGEVGWEGSP